jgi:enamine deaminase RidA (YjgF/YER057c/UK114 family)
MTWFLLDRAEYTARLKEIGAVYRDIMGRRFPAMTAVEVSGLIEDRAKVEIQAMAVVPDPA